MAIFDRFCQAAQPARSPAPQKNKPVSAVRETGRSETKPGHGGGGCRDRSGLSVGLLLSEVSNHGQLEHLALVRLQQKDDPEDEQTKAQGHPQQKGD